MLKYFDMIIMLLRGKTLSSCFQMISFHCVDPFGKWNTSQETDDNSDSK